MREPCLRQNHTYTYIKKGHNHIYTNINDKTIQTQKQNIK